MKVQSIIEKMLFTTTRIETHTDSGFGIGTAFIFGYEVQENHSAKFLVTNKHVKKDAKYGEFGFHRANDQNEPILENPYIFTVEDFTNAWFDHPSPAVDISIMPLDPLIEKAQKSNIKLYFHMVTKALIPDRNKIEELDALEEIYFIGYPNGIYDSYNYLPILRRGTTATSLQVDYDGQPVFLVDASVFPGSSGSPVFLTNVGGYTTKLGGRFFGPPRIYFLGVIADCGFRKEQGEFQNQAIPSGVNPIVQVNQMIDLGLVFKSSLVVEVVEEFLRSKGEL